MAYILASKSPRRHAYLTELGIPFTVLTRETDESLAEGITPRQGVEILARRKAEALTDAVAPTDVVIAADTLVELDGRALGKPIDEADAKAMLRRLSGSRHTVHTGVAVKKGDTLLSDGETTVIRFRPLSDGEIDAYIASGEPMDKAGAYGIQGGASAFVESIEGEFDNVVGLPCKTLVRLLREIEKC
jgi:septum formation protein